MLESVDGGLNVLGKSGRPLEGRPLMPVKRYELEGQRQPSLEAQPSAELALEDLVEVDGARLELGPDRVVDPVRHAVLDLVPDLEEELQVLLCAALYRATGMPKAFSKFPVSVRSLTGRVPVVSVVDPLPPKPGVQEIGPGNHCGDEEYLAPKGQSGAVERLDGGDHRLSCLQQQLVTPDAQARFPVKLRPAREEVVQFGIESGWNAAVNLALADLTDESMIDGPRRPGEIGENVLVNTEFGTSGEHCLHEGDLPLLKASALAPPGLCRSSVPGSCFGPILVEHATLLQCPGRKIFRFQKESISTKLGMMRQNSSHGRCKLPPRTRGPKKGAAEAAPVISAD